MALRPFHPSRLLAIASLAIVGAIAFLEWRDPSSGSLAAVHAREAALVSDGGCERCHGSGAQHLADACLKCHAEILEQLERRSGLHGTLDDPESRHCGRCHAEHRGTDFELVSAHAFALAGVAEVARYDHAHAGRPLEGAHRALACTACHRHAADVPLERGALRYLGLDARCASCHEDPHDGALPSCASCHGQERPFAEVASFEHVATFPLTGPHAGVACLECHELGGERSVEALRTGNPQESDRGCADCHRSPHAADLLAAVGEFASRTTAAATCEICHAASNERFAAVPDERMRTLHFASGFLLDAAHERLACASCHGASGAGATYAERYPGSRKNDCRACHGDPHVGQFERGVFAGSSCTDCHASTHFAPSRIDAAMHARTPFGLEGRHVEAQCTSCHPPSVEGSSAPRIFAAAPSACAACHVDPHRGQFDARPGAFGCAACHDAQSFGHSSFDRAAHAATAFPLEGRHASIACALCHVPTPGSTTPGDRVFRDTATACAECHTDPHRGQFAAPGSASTDCSRCHDTDSFSRSAFTEAEHARAGFALTGAHRAVSCDRCHVDVSSPEGEHRRFRGTPRECAECHADVHRGRFDRASLPREVEGASGCARCHNTEAFHAVARVAFDHATWTGFALVGRHARARCEQCHAPDPDPRAARRLGFAHASCAECHADPHAGQFRENGANDCARCHDPAAARFAVRPSFDHARDTHFALDATHAALACSTCHAAQEVAGRRAVVRYKPLGTRCEDCHAAPKRRGDERR